MCTFITNPNMQNKIILQVLSVPNKPLFQFFPHALHRAAATPCGHRTQARVKMMWPDPREKKKYPIFLGHLLPSDNALPQHQHPQSRFVLRNTTPAGAGRPAAARTQNGKPAFGPYGHSFWKTLNHQLIEESFSVFQIPLLYNGK